MKDMNLDQKQYTFLAISEDYYDYFERFREPPKWLKDPHPFDGFEPNLQSLSGIPFFPYMSIYFTDFIR